MKFLADAIIIVVGFAMASLAFDKTSFLSGLITFSVGVLMIWRGATSE